MDFNLSEEQSMLRESANRFFREQYSFEQRRAEIAQDALGWKARWRQYAELGWLGLCVPEAFGGLACSSVEMVVLMEQFGSVFVTDPIVPLAFVTPYILQKSPSSSRWMDLLAAICSGDTTVTLAHCESGSWSYQRPRVRARKTPSGYEISGTKMLVQAGELAHLAIVPASVDTDTDPELALFLVDLSIESITRHAYRLLDGRVCADITFTRTHLDEESLILWGDVASDLLDQSLDIARLATLAESLGGMETCMQLTSDYLKSRVQFGLPLSRFQALQHAMADMFVDIQDARSSLYRALAFFDLDPNMRRSAIASAQLVVGNAGRKAAAVGVQLHGGYGLTDEYPISHGYRQQLVLEKLWGDAQDALRRMSVLT